MLEPRSEATPSLRLLTAALRTRALFGGDERGQGLTEYALVILVVALGSVAAYSAFGTTISHYINNAAALIPH